MCKTWHSSVGRGAFAPAVLAIVVGFFSLSAQESEPPGALYDAGDHYVLRDRSVVPLLRSAREIAIKRAKTLAQQDVVRFIGAQGVIKSVDACGALTTHQIEVFSVSDLARARAALAALDDVVWVSPVLSAPDSGKRILATDEIIVQFEDDATVNGVTDTILEDLASRGLEIAREPLPSAPGQYLLRANYWDAELAMAEAVGLNRVPGIAWAEPNFVSELELYATPNDPLFAWQQALHNTGQNGAVADADVDAPEAWNIRTGNERLVIAIIDSGVDTGHPDLRIFRNDAEWGNGREANGVDNDGNGYIDDHQGWDFYGNDNNPNPGSGPGVPAHGTACAGIAAAIGNNNLGIVGATWNCRILPVKMFGDDGAGDISVAAIGDAIRYAAQFADVISCSWGWYPPSSAIESGIDYATVFGRSGRGCAVLFASGNEGGYWQLRPSRIPCAIYSPGHSQLRIFLLDTLRTLLRTKCE